MRVGVRADQPRLQGQLLTRASPIAPQLIGREPSVLKSGEQDIDFYRDLWQTITAGREWRAAASLLQSVREVLDAPIRDEPVIQSLWRRPPGRISPAMNSSTPPAGATARRDASHGARLLAAWRRLSPRPGGRWLFSRMIGRMAPYSGSMGAQVAVLEPGRAVLTLRDRRAVRNHLRSVHAIALANLGELASGLAASAAMAPGVRGIPVEIRIEYLRKARGTLTATGVADLPDIQEKTDVTVHADICNTDNETVARVTVRWQMERV